MKLPIFIYIVINFVFIQILSLGDYAIINTVNALCLFGIFTIGLSHGAIDDILHYKTTDVESKNSFILKYLLAISVYCLIWLLLPNFAVVSFIIISGYHFGQAQFIESNLKGEMFSKLLYSCWGISIILLLFYFNKDLLLSNANKFPGIPIALSWMIKNSGVLVLICLVFYNILMSYFLITKKISFEKLAIEIFLLIITAISFLLLHPFISFSLFFVILHSFQAINHEFNFFKSHMRVQNLRSFIKILAPFTMVSLLGLAVILTVVNLLGFGDFIPFVILILISSITAPHSFVMNKFYSSDKFIIDSN